MRSKKPDLEEVKAEFAAWRRERRGRAIPENLWKAALRLLDRYSSSTICVALGLNGSRFRQVREARNHGGLVPRKGRAAGRNRGASPGRVTALRPAFIELPSVAVGSGSLMAPARREVEHASGGYRLTLESAFGRLSVLTFQSPEAELIEEVCRWALGGPADGCRS